MDWVRKATGSAVIVLNEDGHVLLVRRAYPPHDWILPGGNAEEGESPTETAIREVREELGITVTPERLTGIYYQPDHAAGEFIHFAYACTSVDGRSITPDPAEVAELGFFRPDRLPEPMGETTRRRLADALAPDPPRLPITFPRGAED